MATLIDHTNRDNLMANNNEMNEEKVLALKLRDKLIALLQGNNLSERDILLEDYQSSPCHLNP